MERRTFVSTIERRWYAATRLSGRNNPSRITYSGDAWYSWTLIQKGRGRDWQCQGSGMKRRGGGNRSARRVICIHVRCCLATWQPGQPPHLFSSISIRLLLALLILSPVPATLSVPPRRLDVCPPSITFLGNPAFLRRSRFHGREPSH